MPPAEDSVALFFKIWIAPRDTIRQIVDSDPRRHVIAIAALSGALSSLEGSWLGAMSEPRAMAALWPLMVALKVVLFAVWAIVGLYVAGWMITAACRVLGGLANSVQTRAAIAWASIPGIAATGLGVIGLLAGIVTPRALRPGAFSFPPELMILSAILGAWGLVLELKCVGEVNHFSAWRALAAQLIVLAVLVAIIVTPFIWREFR
jgi:hypothetical protein